MRVNFHQLVFDGVNVDLKKPAFVERAVKKTEQTLVSDVRTVVCAVFLVLPQ